MADRSHTRASTARQTEDDSRLGAPFRGEALTRGHPEILPRNDGAGGGHVRVDQLRIPADLHAPKGPSGFEHDEHATRITLEMAQLHVALGDHNLERVAGPTKPDGTDVRTAIAAVGRQYCRSGGFERERTRSRSSRSIAIGVDGRGAHRGGAPGPRRARDLRHCSRNSAAS